VRHIDRVYIALGALYLVIGMVLGIVLGVKEDFLLSPVHAHINLLGFAAHCIFGLVYRAWPELKQGALAAAQFWLFVVGSPLFMVGLTLTLTTHNPTLTIIGSLLVTLGALLFLIITGRRLLHSGTD
jgi:hypothetical protein